jgi:hypothetical protein
MSGNITTVLVFLLHLLHLLHPTSATSAWYSSVDNKLPDKQLAEITLGCHQQSPVQTLRNDYTQTAAEIYLIHHRTTKFWVVNLQTSVSNTELESNRCNNTLNKNDVGCASFVYVSKLSSIQSLVLSEIYNLISYAPAPLYVVAHGESTPLAYLLAHLIQTEYPQIPLKFLYIFGGLPAGNKHIGNTICTNVRCKRFESPFMLVLKEYTIPSTFVPNTKQTNNTFEFEDNSELVKLHKQQDDQVIHLFTCDQDTCHQEPTVIPKRLLQRYNSVKYEEWKHSQTLFLNVQKCF